MFCCIPSKIILYSLVIYTPHFQKYNYHVFSDTSVSIGCQIAIITLQLSSSEMILRGVKRLPCGWTLPCYHNTFLSHSFSWENISLEVWKLCGEKSASLDSLQLKAHHTLSICVLGILPEAPQCGTPVVLFNCRTFCNTWSLHHSYWKRLSSFKLHLKALCSFLEDLVK